MGIYIYISISKSVTKKEWEKVYEETLQLVKAFPLAEKQNVKCQGIDTICLVPTQERAEAYGWHDEKTRLGWYAVGDYETRHTAEDYFLPRDLVGGNEVEPDAGDALIGTLPAYMNFEWEDPRFNHFYALWGNKTQGEPYHMYLLAIACMIESRLGEKAFVYGDITSGQCRKAVELANRNLAVPIAVPDRCDMERLWKRISKLPFSKREQLAIFECYYMGIKDAQFGEYVRSRYSEDVCDEYWKDRFEDSVIGTIGFDEKISDYLLWGFNLEKLCSFVNYNDKENNPQYEKFVKRIMDAKLHLKEKKCDDILGINPEEEAPYSVYTLLAQFVFAGAKNKKVDRYSPVDEIRKALKSGLGDKCDVDTIIDEYLAKEAEEIGVKVSEELVREEEMNAAYGQDASEVFQQVMDFKLRAVKESLEKYDISTYEDLSYYKKGDTIQPGLKEALKKSYIFYNSILEEDGYIKLLEKPAIECCEWLIKRNRTFLIRDKDWDKIFMDIKENKEAFARYYPMMRVKLDSDNLIYMIEAIVLNDELYDYCKEFPESYPSHE